MKCTIHSSDGSIMVIPRENKLVRLYIQIASSTDKDWNPRKQASIEDVQNSAKRILNPYWIQWDRVEWYSVYPIGQGIAEKYTLDHRVFLGGDACHTHSVIVDLSGNYILMLTSSQPKAGQGMNTAFHDALNLAWKVHHVESGFADRAILESYESERKSIAENLLNFDAKYATLFSQRQPSAGEVSAASEQKNGSEEPNEFVELYKASCEFTSGYGIAYGPNTFNWSSNHPARSPLFHPKGTALRTGHVMLNADVTRVVDANPAHLEQEVPMNGSFRIYLFAGVPSMTRRAVTDFANNLNKKHSFYKLFERLDIAQVSYHEQHNPHSHFFTICTIFAAPRSSIEIAEALPVVLARYSALVYADDIEDPRNLNVSAVAHAKMGLDQERGGVVVVRPDGHVACVVQLVEGNGTVDALNEYFTSFAAKSIGETKVQAQL